MRKGLEYDAHLRARAAANPRIRFLGAVSQQELGPLYAHALACLVPSVSPETFNQTVIESFVHKTPVIARDLGALPELLHLSGGGLIYRDDRELLEALRLIATSPSLCLELGEKGYGAVVEHWSREAHLRLYFELLCRTARRKWQRVPWESSTEQAFAE